MPTQQKDCVNERMKTALYPLKLTSADTLTSTCGPNVVFIIRFIKDVTIVRQQKHIFPNGISTKRLCK